MKNTHPFDVQDTSTPEMRARLQPLKENGSNNEEIFSLSSDSISWRLDIIEKGMLAKAFKNHGVLEEGFFNVANTISEHFTYQELLFMVTHHFVDRFAVNYGYGKIKYEVKDFVKFLRDNGKIAEAMLIEKIAKENLPDDSSGKMHDAVIP